MRRELHFPTPIYIFDIKDQSLNIQLEKNVLNWMSQDQGIKRTNVQGWHSTTDMHKRPEYDRLTKALHEAQYKIYEEEHYDSEPFLGNMWANVNPPGGFIFAHIFPIVAPLSTHSSANICSCIINNSSTKGLNTGISCMFV